MRTITHVILSCVVVAVMATGCSSEPQTSQTSEPADTTDGTTVGAGSVVGDSNEIDTSAPGAVAPSVPPVTTAGVAMDERYVTLANLDADAFCAITPLAELEVIVGAPITTDPVISHIAGLSTDCAWYSDDNDKFVTVAELQISPYAWSFVETTFGIGDSNTAPDHVECVVADRPAICQDGYEDNGLIIPSNVHVQLGSDADYALYAASELGIAQAQAIATLAVNNISD